MNECSLGNSIVLYRLAFIFIQVLPKRNDFIEPISLLLEVSLHLRSRMYGSHQMFNQVPRPAYPFSVASRGLFCFGYMKVNV